MRSQKALVMEAGGMGVVSLPAFLKVCSLVQTVYKSKTNFILGTQLCIFLLHFTIEI